MERWVDRNSKNSYEVDWPAYRRTNRQANRQMDRRTNPQMSWQTNWQIGQRTRRRARRRAKKRSNKALLLIILALLLAVCTIGKCGAWFNSDGANDGRIDISTETEKGTFPAFLQGDPRWSDKPYGNNTMTENGCGPTCLSIVYCFLTGNDTWNPYNLACKLEEEGYYVDGSGTAWLAMTEFAHEIGLNPYDVRFEENAIKSELKNGTPIICAMKPGDFTTSGHFIVLTGIDGRGNVTVQDPNSRENSEKAWPLDVLMPQIKNLWGYEKATWFF